MALGNPHVEKIIIKSVGLSMWVNMVLLSDALRPGFRRQPDDLMCNFRVLSF